MHVDRGLRSTRIRRGVVTEGKKKKRKQRICVYAGEVKSCYFLQSDFRSLLFTHETNKQTKKLLLSVISRHLPHPIGKKKKNVYASDPSQLCYPHPTGSVAVNLFPLSLHLFFPPPTPSSLLRGRRCV